ncbi:MAG: DUF2442 domain-containing protein [Ktedonobacteraceae bacterium]
MTKLVRVQCVEPKNGFSVAIQFTDGSQKQINLEPYLQGPIFEPMRDNVSVFRSMYVEEGTIAWPNGADIDPDVLYYGLTPAWAVSDTISSSEQQTL